MARLLRSSGRLAGSVLLVVLAGCPGPEPTAPEGVIYEGGTTDETWIFLDEAEPIVSDADAPMLVDPAGPVPRSTPVTFTWTPGAVAHVSPRGVRVREELAELLLGPARAQAHGDPYTGPLFRLTLTVPGGEVVRVLTGTTSWTPDATAWSRLTGGGSPLSLEIVGAYARLNRIEEGPFVRATPASVVLE